MNDIISNPNIITSSTNSNIVNSLNNTNEIFGNTIETIDTNLNNFSSVTKENIDNNSTLINNISFFSILKYLIIIILLSLLGFNIFKNLGVILDIIDTTIKKIYNFISNIIISKPTTNIQNNVIGVNKNTDEIENTNENTNENTKNNKDINTLDKILNDTEEKLNIKNNETSNENNIFKSGYCYVGEDRGYRTCIKVGEIDKCMSGDIFPNKEICINPNLRM